MKYVLLLLLSLLITFIKLDGFVVCHAKPLGGASTTSISQSLSGMEIFTLHLDAEVPFAWIVSMFAIAVFPSSYLSLYAIYTFLICPIFGSGPRVVINSV